MNKSTHGRSASLGTVVKVFLRVGNLTFGGGNPTMVALRREFVNRRNWLTSDEFALSYALARMTPGTNLFALTTALGWQLGRWRGALAALLAASLPCCLIVGLTTAAFEAWGGQPLVKSAVDGAMAASVGILVVSAWLLVAPYLSRGHWLRNGSIALGSLSLSYFAGLAPIPVLVLAAVVGWLWPERET